ncbi:MAG TPA: hypothetical protein VFE55_03305 [Acidimicrobiia bacterium]|nr:hypothetical protein [Acidimicrobiia bacterium]
MADVIYLFLIAAFFGLAALFVKACEALIGPDEAAAPEDVDATEPEPLAA